jgi:Delta3-Delta2-enoyl-CoA isomerase
VFKKNDKAAAKGFIEAMMGMFKRVLLFPMPTIVAITGHAFAGGAIWSCYFDFRFMRSDRGYLCYPEVDLGIPFLPGMLAAMKKATPRHTLEEMVLTGKRLTAAECQAHNIITKACPMETLMEETLRFAKTLNKKRSTVAAMKADLNKDVVYALEHEDPPIIDSGRFFV